MNTQFYDVAVIGGGSAGTMAAQRAVLNNDNTILFPGSPKDKKKSRAMWVAKVENMPAHFEYKKGIMKPNMEVFKFLEACELKDKFHHMKNRGIVEISHENGLFTLKDNKGEEYFAKYVILCTGVMDVQPEIGGNIEPVFPFANAQVIDYCLRCDGHHIKGKHTGIIGHGAGAAWVAVMLYERYEPPSMTIYTHGEEHKVEGEVAELCERYNIKVNTEKILDLQGNAKIPRLDNLVLEKSGPVKCEFAFVSLGMIVYNELALALGAQVDKRGFVVTDEKGQSSIDGLYVAGDLRAGIKKQIYTAWDSAVDSADAINGRLRAGKRKMIASSILPPIA